MTEPEPMRQEHDLLGAMTMPVDQLWGIHTQRACANFQLAHRPIHHRLWRAYGLVKLACVQSIDQLQPWPDPVRLALTQACEEMAAGQLDDQCRVDALQGGAGTSTNMNVNEVMANRALQIMGHQPGDYHLIDPLDDVNRYQSTNDTFPTALKVAAIYALRELEAAVVVLLEAFQAKEKQLGHVVKVGRTQLQDAVLTTVGRQMSCYADALARDRWRIYKCEERLRVVNLGGTAIGTGVGAPRQFIFTATDRLRQLTGIGLARAENLVEATQNTDVFVEVSGIVRALASNLIKIANDLRLAASGPDAGIGELKLPPRQAGSTIMPGKVNPVIPETVVQAGLAVFGYDSTLTQACSAGQFELNHLLPLVADCLLQSLDLMQRACVTFAECCVRDLVADEAHCRMYVNGSTATVTALVGALGYQKASALAASARASGKTIRQQVLDDGLMDAAMFDQLTCPDAVTRLGMPHVPTTAEDTESGDDDS